MMIRLIAKAPYNTRRFGHFEIHVFRGEDPRVEHIALLKGDVSSEPVLCRIASSCLTSTAFDASDCDCKDQIDEALQTISAYGSGVLIYLDQEGRGHGLATKVLAMNHKAAGLDTFQAVHALGLPADVRTYADAASILDLFGVSNIALLTNSPTKLAALRKLGIEVPQVLPCRAKNPPAGAARHLAAKRNLGHTV